MSISKMALANGTKSAQTPISHNPKFLTGQPNPQPISNTAQVGLCLVAGAVAGVTIICLSDSDAIREKLPNGSGFFGESEGRD